MMQKIILNIKVNNYLCNISDNKEQIIYNNNICKNIFHLTISGPHYKLYVINLQNCDIPIYSGVKGLIFGNQSDLYFGLFKLQGSHNTLRTAFS